MSITRNHYDCYYYFLFKDAPHSYLMIHISEHITLRSEILRILRIFKNLKERTVSGVLKPFHFLAPLTGILLTYFAKNILRSEIFIATQELQDGVKMDIFFLLFDLQCLIESS